MRSRISSDLPPELHLAVKRLSAPPQGDKPVTLGIGLPAGLGAANRVRASSPVGALHQMLAGLDEAGREAAWQEVGQALGEFEDADGFTGPCELLVGAATR